MGCVPFSGWHHPAAHSHRPLSPVPRGPRALWEPSSSNTTRLFWEVKPGTGPGHQVWWSDASAEVYLTTEGGWVSTLDQARHSKPPGRFCPSPLLPDPANKQGRLHWKGKTLHIPSGRSIKTWAGRLQAIRPLQFLVLTQQLAKPPVKVWCKPPPLSAEVRGVAEGPGRFGSPTC